MMIMHTSRHTDVWTADYYSLHTQQKLHHCVTDVRQRYPIAPLFRGDLAHVQTMCTRLSLSLHPSECEQEMSLGTRLLVKYDTAGSPSCKDFDSPNTSCSKTNLK